MQEENESDLVVGEMDYIVSIPQTGGQKIMLTVEDGEIYVDKTNPDVSHANTEFTPLVMGNVIGEMNYFPFVDVNPTIDTTNAVSFYIRFFCVKYCVLMITLYITRFLAGFNGTIKR